MTTLSIYLGSCKGTDADSISAATLAEAKTAASASAGSLTELHVTVMASELATAWSPMDLASFTDALQANGKVIITVKPSDATPSLEALHTSFLLAGLVGTAEKKLDDGSRELIASKIPKESVPRAAPLKPKNTANAPTTKVTINLNDDEDLINEENLLSDASNLLGAPPEMSAVSSKDDCAGREPCDNCTCGRADPKKNDAAPAAKEEVKKSSCGKCGLGDAFRCASCPYLGKPAFKPGEEHLVLDLQDDI